MYVPDLIPKEHQVLDDYFKKHAYASKSRSGESWQAVNMGIAAILFLLAFINIISHFWLGVLFALLGLIFFPKGQHWLEDTFQFELAPKIKAGFSACILVASGFAGIHYAKVDKEIALQEEAIELQEKKVAEEKEQMRLEAVRIDNAKMDSIISYVNQADHLTSKKRYNQAIAAYDVALGLAVKGKPGILAKKANCLIASGQYDAAISDLTTVMNLGEATSDVFLQRAICYKKQGKIQTFKTQSQNQTPQHKMLTINILFSTKCFKNYATRHKYAPGTFFKIA